MKCYFILLWFGWQDGLTSEKSVVFKVEQRSITFTLVYNARFWLIFYWTLCGILYSALIDVVLQYNNFHYYGVWTLHTHKTQNCFYMWLCTFWCFIYPIDTRSQSQNKSTYDRMKKILSWDNHSGMKVRFLAANIQLTSSGQQMFILGACMEWKKDRKHTNLGRGIHCGLSLHPL